MQKKFVRIFRSLILKVEIENFAVEIENIRARLKIASEIEFVQSLGP